MINKPALKRSMNDSSHKIGIGVQFTILQKMKDQKNMGPNFLGPRTLYFELITFMNYEKIIYIKLIFFTINI